MVHVHVLDRDGQRRHINLCDIRKSFFFRPDNSDLDLELDRSDYCSARCMSHRGFGYMWSGARATYGVTRGRACYEVQKDV